MPETASRASRSCTTACTASRTAGTPTPTPAPPPAPLVRGRIGVDRAGGFYPAPYRYALFLNEGCPDSQQLSATVALLGLERFVYVTTLPTPPAEAPEAYAALLSAYEATVHPFAGPPTAPALVDRWSGRLVSNHTPDILDDLAGPLSERVS
jgi:putative glutathione S-transferase